MEQYRIMKAISGFYYVWTPDGIVECKARGRFRKEGITPLVGDLVEISVENGKGMLETILPRKNAFLRPAVANIDLLIILASCAIPVTEPFLIDRIMAIAQLQRVPVLLCINKEDLADPSALASVYRHAGVDVVVTSAATGTGISQLREKMEGRFSCFTGNSGVGKSSLLNCLIPDLQLLTAEISEKLGRGRHTTRHIELYPLSDSTYVADTPGFSSFDTERMELVDQNRLQYAFQEFEPYIGSCQFLDCAHRKEPGCAVRRALAEGKIEQSRYDSYERLYTMASQIESWQMGK